MSESKRERDAKRVQRFRAHPAYKGSDVEWLGEIPANWVVLPLKRIAHIHNGADHKPVEAHGGYPVIGSGGPFAYASKFVHNGESVLLGRKGTVDRPLYINGPFWTVDTMYWTKISDVASARFIYYAAMTIPFDFYSTSTALPSITQSALGNHPVALPSLDEQRTIAAFLDRETARIDALVTKKEQLIGRLQEKRTSSITRAVTKGLDPTAPMKDSGVEWLGEIPSHWGVKQLRQATELLMDFRGRTPAKLGMDWGGEIPAISAVNVRDGYLDLTRGVNYGSQELHDRWMAHGSTKSGDVLFTTEAPLGNVATVPDDDHYILSQRVVLIRPRPTQLIPSYFLYLLSCSAFRQGVEVVATGSTAEGIKRRYLMAMPVCVPQIDEQRAITTFLEREIGRIDALVARVRDAIERLKEFRAALIAAAVTGKIDVREETA